MLVLCGSESYEFMSLSVGLGFYLSVFSVLVVLVYSVHLPVCVSIFFVVYDICFWVLPLGIEASSSTSKLSRAQCLVGLVRLIALS